MDQHLLSIVLFAPLAGFAVLLLIPGSQKNLIKVWANLVGFASFLVSLPLVTRFDNDTPGFQSIMHPQFHFEESANWIPSLGAHYHIGIDGISLLLIMLTTLMGFLAILSSWNAIDERVKEYYAMFLLLQTGMIGVFVSLDFFLFYVFWELVLVPMYFIIGVWGGPRKLYAAIKFFLYTRAGSVLMLLGILTLYFQYHQQFGTYTFEIADLMKLDMPLGMQQWVFWAFFLGFAIKVPMFPFHTWLPDAHVEAPTAGSVILASVLLKMGTYGFIRFSLPLLPKASVDQTIVQILAVLSIVGIIYGALVCLMQQDPPGGGPEARQACARCHHPEPGGGLRRHWRLDHPGRDPDLAGDARVRPHVLWHAHFPALENPRNARTAPRRPMTLQMALQSHR